jgi:copper(I)-binding protein
MRFAGWVVGAALCVAAVPVWAADAGAGAIAVEKAWARASAGQAPNGAAFLTIRNTGAQADQLVAASADVSTKTELHTHIKEGEVMKMRPVDAIAVPAGGAVELKPGGDHVMFMGLTRQLKQGESFPLTLKFAHAGEVKVTVEVQSAGAMSAGGTASSGAMGTMNHGSMDHGNMHH